MIGGVGVIFRGGVSDGRGAGAVHSDVSIACACAVALAAWVVFVGVCLTSSLVVVTLISG